MKSLVCVFTILLVAVLVRQPDADEPVVTPSTAATAGRRSVTALGRLEPATQVIDIGAPSEERIARLLVAEGDWVEVGAPLFHVESHPTRLAERELAAARLANAERGLAAERAVFQALVDEAQIDVRVAAELEPMEIEAQGSRLRSLEAQLEAARRELERVQGVGDTVSQKERQAQELAVRTAEEAVKAATADLQARRLSHEIGVLRAGAALTRQRAEQIRAEVLHAVEPWAAQLALASAELERTIIRAPVAGEILKVFVFPGERAGHGAVLQMGNVREMHAVAEVYESDARFVQVGQRATITSSALPKPVRGEVLSVARLIFKNDVLDVDPAADVDSRVVEARIRLEPDELVARLTNLHVDVAIHLADVEPDHR